MPTINSRFSYRSTARDVVSDVDLRGRTALVTGATSGIGLETARALALAGSRLILPARDVARGRQAADEILRDAPDTAIDLRSLDLASLHSVRTLASELTDSYDQLDIVINNAGVMATPFGHTVDGFETQFGTNHVGHFALFQGVASLLASSEAPRVVAVSSIAHRISDIDFDDIHFAQRPYDKWIAYGQSKTACALFAVGVAAHSGIPGISAFAVHPGGIMTGLQKFLPRDEMMAMGWVDDEGNVNELFKTVEEGAATSVWAATAPELNGHTGLYLENCQQAEAWRADLPMMGVRDYALDPAAAERLWSLSLDAMS